MQQVIFSHAGPWCFVSVVIVFRFCQAFCAMGWRREGKVSEKVVGAGAGGRGNVIQPAAQSGTPLRSRSCLVKLDTFTQPLHLKPLWTPIGWTPTNATTFTTSAPNSSSLFLVLSVDRRGGWVRACVSVGLAVLASCDLYCLQQLLLSPSHCGVSMWV